ncbi:PREDICTED: interferon gamma [Chrysochloris asiatica]|uniref:Interferon gamma n=1 Tax=Chrysochloris asiatica TaxID=185453 RepID=A0A9B0TDI5_CHRAS|nr:PREDICTED: interferon gamma [Chrysochloris asiatica]
MNYTSYLLAFQLCIILGSSSCFCQSTVLKEIQNLKEYLNATDSDVADGRPLFSEILKTWKEEGDKKIFQSQIVSLYLKIFENLEGNQIIQKSINTIKEDLFVKFFNSSINKWNEFLKLAKTPANDRKIQRKAINELTKVLNDLSPTSNLRKRKRSQSPFFVRRASE